MSIDFAPVNADLIRAPKPCTAATAAPILARMPLTSPSIIMPPKAANLPAKPLKKPDTAANAV